MPIDKYEKEILLKITVPKKTGDKLIDLDDELQDLMRILRKTRNGDDSVTGILLKGPPGCGKTSLMQKVAEKSNFLFINVRASDISSSYYGESAKLATALFSLARKLKPTILFMDEVDSLLRQRDASVHEETSRVNKVFLDSMEGILPRDGTIPVGCTNFEQVLDNAFRQRFNYVLELRLPREAQRREYISTIFPTTLDHNKIVDSSDGFSYRQLNQLKIQSESVCFLCKKNDQLEMPDVETALEIMKGKLSHVKDSSWYERNKHIENNQPSLEIPETFPVRRNSVSHETPTVIATCAAAGVAAVAATAVIFELPLFIVAGSILGIGALGVWMWSQKCKSKELRQ